MIIHFSQNSTLNPNGWVGDNWENRGYDIISYFPEFSNPDCSSCGQGYGDIEVDYQDTTEDFWPITAENEPIGIITFSRGYMDQSWELEFNAYNRTNWYNDLLTKAETFDTNNIHSLENNLPLYIQESSEYGDLKDFLSLQGEQYDLIRNHIDSFGKLHNRGYEKLNSPPENVFCFLFGIGFLYFGFVLGLKFVKM